MPADPARPACSNAASARQSQRFSLALAIVSGFAVTSLRRLMKAMTALKDAAAPLRRLALALGMSLAALSTAGCSASVIDSIPTWAGGEPSGTPDRPAVDPAYPPVHDRPPARDSKVISEQDEAKIEKELATARDIQAARAKKVQKDRSDMLADTPQPPRPVNSGAN
jgi:hypothetical protein